MNLSKKILGISLLPLFILALSSVIGGFFIHSHNKTIRSYVSDHVKRQNTLYDIYLQMGYGGGIHAFKNYILRSDTKYREAAVLKMTKAKMGVQEYLSFSPLSEEETQAMNVLYSTITKYEQMIEAADKMIKKGYSQAQIDKKVKVDDGPAVAALESLEKFYQIKRQEEMAKLESANKMALNSTIIVFLIALFTALFISQKIARKMVASIKKLVNVSEQISKGNFKFKNNQTVDFSEDELKVLAAGILNMGANLQDTFEKLHRTNEELNEFAFVASHDLQEPIKKISSYVELLEMESENVLNTDAKTYLGEVKSSTDRMIKMIKALLDYSEKTETRVDNNEVDLNEVIDICKYNLEIRIDEANAKIVTNNLPIVLGNKELLVSLFQNLISNSLKYRKKEEQPTIEIKAEKTEMGQWQLVFRDNGIGFDLKYLDKILRPFGRIHSKSEYPGVGIGLSLCKKIIESHGGNLQVNSKEGQGSQFKFSLRGS